MTAESTDIPVADEAIAKAAAGFAALSHPQRLSALRMLLAAWPHSIVAGELARRLAIPPSTMTFHLRELERAGLIRTRKIKKFVHVQAGISGTQGLVHFILRDCCGGRPELCAPFASTFGCEPGTCAPATRDPDAVSDPALSLAADS